MDIPEAIKQVDEAAAMSKQETWGRNAGGNFKSALARLRRRPLFQKVIIANTILIAAGTASGIYMAQKYFTGEQLGFLFLFTSSVILFSILVNYVMVRLAFQPLEDVSDTLRAVCGGHHGFDIPAVTDDPQLEEMTNSIDTMLVALDRSRKRNAAAVIKAQEEERKRIARELHDETSQSLTGLMIGIGMVEELVPETMADVRNGLISLRELADETLGEVHTMAIRLRPSILDDLGLTAGLRSYIRDFSDNTGIEVDLRLMDMSKRLPPEMETVLYRVVQEALTNVARHSGAERCKVVLDRLGTKISGHITDDGHGFDPRQEPSAGYARGLGLSGMKERIELLDGTLRFESSPENGVTIRLEVPLDTEEELS